jgi:hypothetical protein
MAFSSVGFGSVGVGVGVRCPIIHDPPALWKPSIPMI